MPDIISHIGKFFLLLLLFNVISENKFVLNLRQR